MATAGGILMVLGLLPKLAAIVASIPQPVLGGAGLALFGMVAASGIRTLSKVKFEGNHNIMVVAVSMGVGLIPIGVSGFYQKFPDALQIVLNSGITAGSVTAIVLNLVLNELVGKPRMDEVTDPALGRPLEEFGYEPGESS